MDHRMIRKDAPTVSSMDGDPVRNIAIAYLVAGFTMVGLDFCWLSLTASFYRRTLGPLLANATFWPAAIAFYPVYLAGVLCFAIWPALELDGWHGAGLRGAFFGLVAYATYDLTNMATLKAWPLSVTVLDMGWGTLLTAITAGVATALTLALEK